MADPAREEEGDEGMARGNRELTVSSTEVVARSGTPCGYRNQGNRAAAPARRKLRLRRLQWLLGHHLLALGVDDDVRRGGHGLRASLRRWLWVLTAVNGRGARVGESWRGKKSSREKGEVTRRVLLVSVARRGGSGTPGTSRVSRWRSPAGACSTASCFGLQGGRRHGVSGLGPGASSWARGQ